MLSMKAFEYSYTEFHFVGNVSLLQSTILSTKDDLLEKHVDIVFMFTHSLQDGRQSDFC